MIPKPAVATGAGYCIVEQSSATYRDGIFAALFPNRLETTLKWEPDAS